MTPEQYERYERYMHAMQTGVGLDQARGSQDGTPKHLRVGVNSAMCDHAALVGLLLEKGIITEDEYVEAVIKQAEAEVERYRRRLNLPPNVDLT